MPTMDQVAWQNANVVVGDARVPFSRNALLPTAITPEELSDRVTLRLVGALRVVEVVYTPEELADQARAMGEATAVREAAHDIDPSLPLEAQAAGTMAGLPTLIGAGGAPVVIGDEDLRAEHERDAEQARARAAEADRARPPAAGDTKAAWVDYAVDVHGADRDDAEQLTKAQLTAQYGSGQSGPPTAADRAGEAQAADRDNAGQ